jgi:peptidoglycan L-alanyl-D-glutamate endopeptidase CwlK
MDQRSERALVGVHPVLAAKVRAAAAILMAQGVEIRVVQGLRSFAEQEALYAKGRTVLTDALGKPQPIVTKARGGYSSHNFGLAVDVAPGVLGAPTWTPDWRVKSAAFVAMVSELKQQGLRWGGDWVTMKGDYDHFYMDGSPDSPTDAMRADLTSGGLPQVFQSCDAGKYGVEG